MIKVDYNRTASLDVDAQKGFTPLCPDELPVPDGHLIVDELNKQATKAKFRIFSKDWHPADAIYFAKDEDGKRQLDPILGEDSEFADKYWARHCVNGTFGSELLKGLCEFSYDFSVYKGQDKNHPYSCVYHDLKKKTSTGLIEFLKEKDIHIIIIGGLALNFETTPLCVGESVIDLCNAGFDVILNLGGTKGLGSDKGREEFVKMLQDKYHVMVVNSADEINLIESKERKVGIPVKKDVNSNKEFLKTLLKLIICFLYGSLLPYLAVVELLYFIVRYFVTKKKFPHFPFFANFLDGKQGVKNYIKDFVSWKR